MFLKLLPNLTGNNENICVGLCTYCYFLKLIEHLIEIIDKEKGYKDLLYVHFPVNILHAYLGSNDIICKGLRSNFIYWVSLIQRISVCRYNHATLLDKNACINTLSNIFQILNILSKQSAPINLLSVNKILLKDIDNGAIYRLTIVNSNSNS